MAKLDADGAKQNPRKRQLNIIYFVDSARTKSLSIPTYRISLAIAMLALLIVWSAGSAATLVWMQRNNADLEYRLESSLATIFEYESRYDRVYEIAYPAGSRVERTVADAEPEPPAKPHAGAGTPHDLMGDGPDEEGHAAHPKAQPVATVASTKPKLPTPPATPKVVAPPVAAVPPPQPGQKLAAVTPPPTPTPTAPAATPAAIASATQAPHGKPEEGAPPADASATPGAQIAVTNPVLEPKTSELELRFDLTNRSGKARAEGYVWAIAEFRSDAGETSYLGAPTEIAVSASGEPQFAEKSASFGIKHYKKKSFSFPYVKDRNGAFVGIKIGVMDKTGKERTTYNVPVDIKVAGKGS